jgi:hypothetical protein
MIRNGLQLIRPIVGSAKIMAKEMVADPQASLVADKKVQNVGKFKKKSN